MTETADQENIKAALTTNSELLEELAEDMSGVFTQFQKSLEYLAAAQQEAQNQAQAIAQMRRELQSFSEEIRGDRLSTMFKNAFKLIVQKMDQLEITYAQLDEETDAKYKRQLESMLDMLLSILDGFGYKPFTVNIGEPFDPMKMCCLGKGEGEKNTVVRIVTKGYVNADIVVRPVNVILGQ